MNFNAVLQILSYFFNPKRWKVRKESKKYNEIKKWENNLAEALWKNETKKISEARAMLKQLREKYKIIDK